MDQGPKSYWAEFLGTFTLCFAGQGAIVMQQAAGTNNLLVIAVAHGLALAVMISALGTWSGGHFNPAVTFGFWVTRRMSLTSAITYWVSQLLGAIAASFLLRAVVPGEPGAAVHFGVPMLSAGVSVGQGFLLEFVMTFFLVTAVWGTAVDERGPKIGGFGIGLTVCMDILFGGPLTGAAMNPARAFGAACASGVWTDHWLYWVAPMAGGAAAARIYKSLMSPR
ncbi:MAG TPA: aquaporin [Verrucomicrobiae bacterium]|jgi:MIP family channel proteins|nr:aquaporin [Verrucomicrobiae bacterium]